MCFMMPSTAVPSSICVVNTLQLPIRAIGAGRDPPVATPFRLPTAETGSLAGEWHHELQSESGNEGFAVLGLGADAANQMMGRMNGDYSVTYYLARDGSCVTELGGSKG